MSIPMTEPREALTFAEFAATNRARCESPDGFGHPLGGWSMSDWFLAAAGEFGEAANKAKKLNRVRDGIPGNTETEDELRAGLADEIADTVIYLDLLTQSLGADLGSIVVSKFNRTSEKIEAPHRLAAGVHLGDEGLIRALEDELWGLSNGNPDTLVRVEEAVAAIRSRAGVHLGDEGLDVAAARWAAQAYRVCGVDRRQTDALIKAGLLHLGDEGRGIDVTKITNDAFEAGRQWERDHLGDEATPCDACGHRRHRPMKCRECPCSDVRMGLTEGGSR